MKKDWTYLLIGAGVVATGLLGYALFWDRPVKALDAKPPEDGARPGPVGQRAPSQKAALRKRTALKHRMAVHTPNPTRPTPPVPPSPTHTKAGHRPPAGAPVIPAAPPAPGPKLAGEAPARPAPPPKGGPVPPAPPTGRPDAPRLENGAAPPIPVPALEGIVPPEEAEHPHEHPAEQARFAAGRDGFIPPAPPAGGPTGERK